MIELGICVDMESKTIRWEVNKTPLKERGSMSDKAVVNMIYDLYTGPIVLMEVEEWQSRILHTDYSTVDTNDYIASLLKSDSS